MTKTATFGLSESAEQESAMLGLRLPAAGSAQNQNVEQQDQDTGAGALSIPALMSPVLRLAEPPAPPESKPLTFQINGQEWTVTSIWINGVQVPLSSYPWAPFELTVAHRAQDTISIVNIDEKEKGRRIIHGRRNSQQLDRALAR